MLISYSIQYFLTAAAVLTILSVCLYTTPELDMGPFFLTQSYPIHQLMDPIQSNPKIAGIKANS